jgi:hypothetical protein
VIRSDSAFQVAGGTQDAKGMESATIGRR